eukprot:1464535-Amphidinium_carterae.1
MSGTPYGCQGTVREEDGKAVCATCMIVACPAFTNPKPMVISLSLIFRMRNIKCSSGKSHVGGRFILLLWNIRPESSKILSVDAPIFSLDPRMDVRASKTYHISAHSRDSSASWVS